MSIDSKKYAKSGKQLETECKKIIEGMLNSELRRVLKYLKSEDEHWFRSS